MAAYLPRRAVSTARALRAGLTQKSAYADPRPRRAPFSLATSATRVRSLRPSALEEEAGLVEGHGRGGAAVEVPVDDLVGRQRERLHPAQEVRIHVAVV